MQTQRILKFLGQIAANNNRQWFNDHKAEYLICKQEFEQMCSRFLPRLAAIDPSIAHITVKDATYRFYRDTRFSPDKSPYKQHLGFYIASHGKKGMHGGYYLHIEPGKCMLACGCYWLPTNILNACRNEIIANIDTWTDIVESPAFLSLFGHASGGHWEDDKGFGISHLKTCPAGFPRDFKPMEYLRMKDYCAWTHVDDTFFDQQGWTESTLGIFQTAKPMMDFINSVIDDYE